MTEGGRALDALEGTELAFQDAELDGDRGLGNVSDAAQTSDEEQEYADEEYDDFDEDYEYFDEDYVSARVLDCGGGVIMPSASSANGHQPALSSATRYQPVSNRLARYDCRIRLDSMSQLSQRAENQLCAAVRQVDVGRCRRKDKSDRATVAQVLDPRTRIIIYQMMERDHFQFINGSISTGKEANVFHASGGAPLNEDGSGTERAIKVYKTSILTFKDRDKYVTGGFRHRHGYSRHNPRKMVRTWAEKEMRNLLRLQRAGVPSPRPLLLRGHVLVMSFIGTDGRAAPKLHDVCISESKARQLYLQLVLVMRTMYQECRLVHADLSEYNVLYSSGEAYIIDVSQAVEHDHRNAILFLRNDCTNITNYFRRHGVATMTISELFSFVVDPSISEQNVAHVLETMMRVTAERGPLTSQQAVDEEVFKHAYIPTRLDEVLNAERDVQLMRSGDVTSRDPVTYTTITGMRTDLTGARLQPSLLPYSDEPAEGNEQIPRKYSCSEDEGQEQHGEMEEGDDSDDDSSKFINSRRPRDESPNSRKERKRAVKDQQAEKRKIKIKKHVKKRKEKEGRKKK